MATQAQLIPARAKVLDTGGLFSLDWILFFQRVITGDNANKFTPDIQGLTSSGSPTIIGVYYQNQGFIDFYVHITPSGSTTSVAGTTYINLPFAVTSDCPCFATAPPSSTVGAVSAANDRAYPPAWTALTVPVTVSGRVPIQ